MSDPYTFSTYTGSNGVTSGLNGLANGSNGSANGNGLANGSNGLLFNRIDPGIELTRRRKFAIRHENAYASLWNSQSRIWRSIADDAVLDDPENSRKMLRDADIRAMMIERIMPSTALAFQVIPDSPKKERQKDYAERYTKLIEATPRIGALKRYLSLEKFYGKYASQVATGREMIDGKESVVICDHEPWSGDKLNWDWDGLPAILVRTTENAPGARYRWSDRQGGKFLMLDTPFWRDRFIIHKYDPIDRDFQFESQLGVQVHGEGLRGLLYWPWLVREQLRTWILNALQRIGVNGMLYAFCNSGNPADEDAILEALGDLQTDHLAVFKMLGNTAQQGINNIAPSPVAYEVMSAYEEILTNQLRMLIIGQTLSSGTEATGMGSSVAEFHRTTKENLIRADVERLGETFTTDVLKPLMKANGDGNLDFRMKIGFSLDKADRLETLQAAQIAHELFDLDEEQLRDDTGFRAPTGPDHAIPKATQIAPGGIGGDDGGKPGGPGMGGGGLNGGGPKPPEPRPSASNYAADEEYFGLVTNYASELTGGQWVTMEGHHVYIKDGKIIAGGHPGMKAPSQSSDESKYKIVGRAPVGGITIDTIFHRSGVGISQGTFDRATPEQQQKIKNESSSKPLDHPIEKASFITSKGSTYDFEDGRTQRTKSLHEQHNPKDVGVKERSSHTVFVSPEFAREVGMWQTSSASKKRLVVAGDKVYLLSWNEGRNDFGLDKIIGDNSFKTSPSVGVAPLEFWKPDEKTYSWLKPGMKVYSGSHPGNDIVKIDKPKSTTNYAATQANYEQQRAPVGGVTIGGTFYPGGKWIPEDVLEKATDEEKAAIEGKGKAEAKAKAKATAKKRVNGKTKPAASATSEPKVPDVKDIQSQLDSLEKMMNEQIKTNDYAGYKESINKYYDLKDALAVAKGETSPAIKPPSDPKPRLTPSKASDKPPPPPAHYRKAVDERSARISRDLPGARSEVDRLERELAEVEKIGRTPLAYRPAGANSEDLNSEWVRLDKLLKEARETLKPMESWPEDVAKWEENRRRIPHLIPPLPIGDRIGLYTEGDRKVKWIAKTIEAAAKKSGIDIASLGRELRESRVAFEGSVAEADKNWSDQKSHGAMIAAEDRHQSAKAAHDAFIGQVRDRIVHGLGAEKPTEFSLDEGDPSQNLPKAPVDAAMSFLSEMFHQGDHSAIGVPVKILPRDTNQRANFDPKKETMNLASGGNASTIVHEMGHAIDKIATLGGDESSNASLAFLKHRVGDEPLTYLARKFPQVGFSQDEVGRKDRFEEAFGERQAYYVGKKYIDNASEILSMGLQKLHDDPLLFAKKDPEYCKFVLGVLDGSLR
jgi:hypothetical protein